MTPQRRFWSRRKLHGSIAQQPSRAPIRGVSMHRPIATAALLITTTVLAQAPAPSGEFVPVTDADARGSGSGRLADVAPHASNHWGYSPLDEIDRAKRRELTPRLDQRIDDGDPGRHAARLRRRHVLSASERRDQASTLQPAISSGSTEGPCRTMSANTSLPRDQQKSRHLRNADPRQRSDNYAYALDARTGQVGLGNADRSTITRRQGQRRAHRRQRQSRFGPQLRGQAAGRRRA